MEHPERKLNRLSEYDYGTNGAYFVTICTQDRCKILSTIVGDGFPVPKPHGMIAEKYIAEIPKKYPTVSVDKFVIMPDHIHLLLRFGLEEGTGNPSLRHSFASVAITNGADIASVSEKLGHTDKAVTLRMYTHADQESIKRASQIFRDAVKQA